MTRIGYFLASEEHGPQELVRQARMAERAGFEGLWISDHYHPWLHEQGESPFVWSVIGGLSQAVSLPVCTAVTCPLMRLHPAIVAQAAATAQVMLQGRFRLGVGTGEALNEHILGSWWPPQAERLEMLREAVEVIRRLFTGKQVTHRGTHFKVDTARLYTVPDTPPPIYMAASGARSTEVAGGIADGLIALTDDPGPLKHFRESGGQGKPTLSGLKVCWGRDEAAAVRTARRLWGTELLKNAKQLLPLPYHFEQLMPMVTDEMVAGAFPCGPDPDRFAAAIQSFIDAGHDEVYVNQIGPEQEGFFAFFADEVLPRLRRT